VISRTTCVVLAAGLSSRFGGEKLTHAPGGFGAPTLLQRAIRACERFPTVVVISPRLHGLLTQHAAVKAVVNDRPELGMAHSLQLADAEIDRRLAIAVLPADLALIEPRDVAAIVAASHGVDVVYPRRADGTPGHPVIFSPHARTRISSLPPGDTIRDLRDHPELTRLVPAIESPWPYTDIDVPHGVTQV
jgi:molybdenum cofactor cytidylyltransferase